MYQYSGLRWHVYIPLPKILQLTEHLFLENLACSSTDVKKKKKAATCRQDVGSNSWKISKQVALGPQRNKRREKHNPKQLGNGSEKEEQFQEYFNLGSTHTKGNAVFGGGVINIKDCSCVCTLIPWSFP